MREIKRLLLFFTLSVLLAALWAVNTPAYAGNIPDKGLLAFPGAQGAGARSRGGRGGQVLFVERLDDPCPTEACTTEDLADPALTTPGTLRWALLQDFPRIILFRVSGIIRLQPDHIERVNGQLHIKRLAAIQITHPYLTIAGQTAPAGGITIAGNGIHILSHDVVLRYLRFRTGRGSRPVFPGQQNPETLMIGNDSARIIIDHCSVSWMPAEGVSVYTGDVWDGTTGTANDITLSWNMIGEGLIQHEDGRGHPNAAFMSGFNGDPKYAARNITLHHNLLLHTQKRNGDLLSYSGQLVNNLIYNWQWLPTVLAGGVKADLIGNVWKPGPLTGQPTGETRTVHLVPAAQDLRNSDPLGWWHAVPGEPSLFLADNAVGSAQGVLMNQRDLLCYYRKRGGKCQDTALKAQWLRAQALRHTRRTMTAIDPVATAERRVLEQAGNSQRINLRGEWVANRDPVDTRYAREYQTMTYPRPRFPWHEREVGGYPRQIEGAAYPDKDRDGLSDVWELMHGLNPADPKDAMLRTTVIHQNRWGKSKQAYTYLELFINGLPLDQPSKHQRLITSGY